MSGYIGQIPTPQATQTRQTFTATASQTSFATGGYQAGYLDVFLNGVKLVDGTDYTATNGSDVVLTTGAASGDTLEVVAYTAFEVLNQNFTGGVTVDNDGATVLTVDRATSDGTIIDLQKEGSSVGSIGSRSGILSYMVLDQRSTDNGFGITSSSQELIACDNSGTPVDGTRSLGIPTGRWKDLYLSGGVYLGGIGSANKLDDYEEGTWTPSVSSGSVTVNKATYTKVGNLVMVQMDVTLGGTRSASTFSVSGLPFLNGLGRWTAISMYHGASIGSHQQITGVVNQGNNAVTFQRMGGDAVGTEFTNTYLNIGGTYMTN